MNGVGRISPGISTMGSIMSQKRGQNPTGLRLKTGETTEWPKKARRLNIQFKCIQSRLFC